MEASLHGTYLNDFCAECKCFRREERPAAAGKRRGHSRAPPGGPVLRGGGPHCPWAPGCEQRGGVWPGAGPRALMASSFRICCPQPAESNRELRTTSGPPCPCLRKKVVPKSLLPSPAACPGPSAGHWGQAGQGSQGQGRTAQGQAPRTGSAHAGRRVSLDL